MSSDSAANDSILPIREITMHDFGSVSALSFTFLRNLAADDLIYTVQLSDDLEIWDPDSSALIHLSSVNQGNGTSRETYLMASQLDAQERKFIRLHVQLQE
ncbi:MAG: hypothetical protein QNL33_10980 [Akkermansiaceae bacterium]